MRVISVLLLALVSFTLCDNSGIKMAITSNIFKLFTKFDFTSLLVNKILIDRAEASGKYLFNYDVICENLFLTDIVQPDKVEIEQETTSDGLPQVKVTLYDIKASIQIEYLYVKYGLIKETFDNPTGSVVVSSIEGRYYFTKEGKLVLSEFNVEIDSFDIDVRKDFLNWLIGLFKGLIKSQVTKALNDLGSTISDGVNDWVDGEFSLDIGYGIGLNLTNTLKPQLTQILKFQKLNEIGLNFAKAIFSKEILEETLTSVLTFGVVGSAYPSDRPDYVPDLPPPAAMDFTTEYFSNELQILLSTYTLNNLLFIAQNSNLLEIEFNNSTEIVFPWTWDTVGLQQIIPQFAEKYPGQNLEVSMKVSISPETNSRPNIEMSETGGKLSFDFNLDFLTHVGGELVEDLALNVAGELPFTIQVKYDLLTINWGTVELTKLVEKKNELNVSYDELQTIVGTMLNTYVIKFIKGYTKNVALAAILTLATGMDFKNFKLETKDGFLLTSIAVDLDK